MPDDKLDQGRRELISRELSNSPGPSAAVAVAGAEDSAAAAMKMGHQGHGTLLRKPLSGRIHLLSEKLPEKATKLKILLGQIGEEVRRLELSQRVEDQRGQLGTGSCFSGHTDELVGSLAEKVVREVSRLQGLSCGEKSLVPASELDRLICTVHSQALVLTELKHRSEALYTLLLRPSQPEPAGGAKETERDSDAHSFEQVDTFSEPSLLNLSTASEQMEMDSDFGDLILLPKTELQAGRTVVQPVNEEEVEKAVEKVIIRNLTSQVHYLRQQLEVCQLTPESRDQGTSTYDLESAEPRETSVMGVNAENERATSENTDVQSLGSSSYIEVNPSMLEEGVEGRGGEETRGQRLKDKAQLSDEIERLSRVIAELEMKRSDDEYELYVLRDRLLAEQSKSQTLEDELYRFLEMRAEEDTKHIEQEAKRSKYYDLECGLCDVSRTCQGPQDLYFWTTDIRVLSPWARSCIPSSSSFLVTPFRMALMYLFLIHAGGLYFFCSNLRII